MVRALYSRRGLDGGVTTGYIEGASETPTMRIELPEHGIAIPVTLTRTQSPGVYYVAGEPTLIVTCWKQRGGRPGQRREVTVWTARFTNNTVIRTDSCGLPDADLNNVARGATLPELRTNVAKYLADEAIGTVIGPRRKYGFHGDQRPSAVRPS